MRRRGRSRRRFNFFFVILNLFQDPVRLSSAAEILKQVQDDEYCLSR